MATTWAQRARALGLASPIALAALSALLTACARLPPVAETAKPAARPPLPVIATFLPISLLTKAVAGDCARVSTLVPPSLAPHDFQARPGDLLALGQARVLVTNGLGMEGFLDKLIASADNADLVVIDSSRGVATRKESEGHGHDHDHGHGGVNPHIWLDPLRAAQQVETIRAGLAAVDPGCAEGYGKRAAAATAELRQLHDTFAKQLRPFAGKTFVAFHDVAPYFAERYGLRSIALVDVPELNPSPADLERVSVAVRGSDLKALLSGPQEGEGSFNALAKDLGVRLSIFNPLETGSARDAEDPGTYGRVMRANVAELIRAFKN